MNYKVETINPYNATHSKKKQMVHLFNNIAPIYDKLSDTFSLGIDYYWRSDALKELRKYPTKRYWISLPEPEILLLSRKRYYSQNK